MTQRSICLCPRQNKVVLLASSRQPDSNFVTTIYAQLINGINTKCPIVCRSSGNSQLQSADAAKSESAAVAGRQPARHRGVAQQFHIAKGESIDTRAINLIC